MDVTGLWIHGMGLAGPLGDTAAATAVAVRAGISRRRSGALVNRAGEPMTISPVPEEALPPLAPELAGREGRYARLLRLATWALREAAAGLPEGMAVPLLLAGPEEHPRLRFDPGPQLFADLQVQSGVAVQAELSGVVAPGRAGALLALAEAHALAGEAATPWVLVGGVDSLIDAELLAVLERDRRVLAAGARDGFAPGEGAAFLLLSRERDLGGSRARARIRLPGVGSEEGHMYARAPHRGDGLATAIEAATRTCAPGAIRTVYAGLNGEHYGTREWQVAAVRNGHAFAGDVAVVHPVDCLGDPGAALGATLLVLAAGALQRGYHGGPALVWAASDGPQRAAAVVDVGGS